MCFFRECFPSARKCVLLWSVLPLHQHVFDLGTIFFCTVMCAFWERSSSAPTCAYPGNVIPLQQQWFLQAIVSASPLYQFIYFFLHQHVLLLRTLLLCASVLFRVKPRNDPPLHHYVLLLVTIPSCGEEAPLRQHVFLLGTNFLYTSMCFFWEPSSFLCTDMCSFWERSPSARKCVLLWSDVPLHQHVLLLGITAVCTTMWILGTIFISTSL